MVGSFFARENNKRASKKSKEKQKGCLSAPFLQDSFDLHTEAKDSSRLFELFKSWATRGDADYGIIGVLVIREGAASISEDYPAFPTSTDNFFRASIDAEGDEITAFWFVPSGNAR